MASKSRSSSVPAHARKGYGTMPRPATSNGNNFNFLIRELTKDQFNISAKTKHGIVKIEIPRN